MLAHIIIGFVGLTICNILLAIAIKHYENCWFITGMISMFGIMASFLLILWAPMTTSNYNHFEIKYEIQQEMFEKYQEQSPELANNITYVADVLEINQELADYQASKLHWAWWSCIPDKVLGLEPIGIKN